ncbi:MAG TPA: efflux transporter periplasmic adaptor subunit [Candidatus Accumulibacter sp.]|nr:efflux transporter periplasmic adaptor subunit [Accumulibacter sp.]HRF10544.1 efflux RND transporter periplasmic adaptor subunit [Candidatus Accumulibacter phosphatis]
MKNRKVRFPLSTWVVAVICVFTSAAQAADRPAKFAVPNNQIQALGIEVALLQGQIGSIKASFPAQVVVPPNAEQVVSAPVAGMVAQLLVQQNDVVRSGTPLVRIASPELGLQQLQLLQATARATLARQAAQREQRLFDEGIIPQRRVQEAKAGLKEAEAARNHAKAVLRLSGMSAATIDRIATSGQPQDSITLAAPQAGIVTEISAKPGQRVEPATALLHVAQTDTLWLDIQIPVTESANWQPGTRLKIQGKDIDAHLLSVSSTVSSGSQTVMLRAVVEGKSGKVRPGEFVTVELPVATTPGSWDVPLSAVAHDGKQAYLFVRTPDGFEARPVMVTTSAGQRVRVQGQVNAGEEVAIAGVVALKGAWLAEKESK